MITHMDNWSMYGGVAARMSDGVYAQNDGTLVADPDGISTGWALSIPGGVPNSPGRVRHVLPANVTTSGIAVRQWLGSLPATSDNVPVPISFKDSSNNLLYQVGVETTGRLKVQKADGTILGETTNPVITADGWYHLEAKLVIDSAVGSIEVRVEGITVISLTDLNTGSTPVSQVEISQHPSGTSVAVKMYAKDFVVWNGSGSYNTDFLGSVLVVNLDPTADVDLNWTPSTGPTGYPILADRPPDDTKYIAAPNPPPAAYVGAMSDLPVDVTSVKAIMTMVRAAKTDGGDASLQVGVISDPEGTPATSLGANRPITVAQTYWRDVFETDPKTDAAWLPTAVNDAEIQINRTA